MIVAIGLKYHSPSTSLDDEPEVLVVGEAAWKATMQVLDRLRLLEDLVERRHLVAGVAQVDRLVTGLDRPAAVLERHGADRPPRSERECAGS